MKDFGTVLLGQDCHAIYTLLYIKQAFLTSLEALPEKKANLFGYSFNYS